MGTIKMEATKMLRHRPRPRERWKRGILGYMNPSHISRRPWTPRDVLLIGEPAISSKQGGHMLKTQEGAWMRRCGADLRTSNMGLARRLVSRCKTSVGRQWYSVLISELIEKTSSKRGRVPP